MVHEIAVIIEKATKVYSHQHNRIHCRCRSCRTCPASGIVLQFRVDPWAAVSPGLEPVLTVADIVEMASLKRQGVGLSGVNLYLH